MHKFLTFLLTVGGSLLIMSSVTFAQTSLNDNPLPLKAADYDQVLTKNRVAKLVDFKRHDTRTGVHRLFVEYQYDANGNVAAVQPSQLVKTANIIIGAIALLYLAVTAIKFIMARGDEEALNKNKVSFAYVILGLMVVAAALNFAFLVFNPESKNFLTGGEVSDRFVEFVDGFKVFIQWIIVAVATVSLIISGYELITRMGSEESFSKEKQFIKHFLLAAALIALTEILVKGVFYARKAGSLNTEQAVDIAIVEIMGVVNFMLGLVAAAATFMLILASFYYMMSFGEEDRANRAKRIIIACIVGIILSLSAYAIAGYFTQFSQVPPA